MTWLLSHALLTGHVFLHFLTRPAHAIVSWSGSLFASRLSTAWCRMLRSQVTNKQISHEPLLLEPLECNKGTTHSDTRFPSVATTALRRKVLQDNDIFCELYADTRSDVSDYSDSESLDSDSDIPTTSSHKQCNLLLVHWPHNFHTHFSSHQDNFYNNVRLAQALLDRNVRVYGTRRANRGIPHDLEAEGKSWKKGKSVFWRNGDVMVRAWKDKTCVNEKYDRWHKCKQREERHENKHGNKEALCCWPVQ